MRELCPAHGLQLALAIPKNLLQSRIGREDLSISIIGSNTDRGGLENRAPSLLARAQRSFGALAVGNVLDDGRLLVFDAEKPDSVVAFEVPLQ